MDVNTAAVRHMAMLSRLNISAAEEEMFARQFSRILGHMEILAGIDTQGIEPLYNPAAHQAPARRDEAANRRSVKEILANAPETDGQYFIVPRII